MLKTADLNRSKKLKSLEWEQGKSYFCYYDFTKFPVGGWHLNFRGSRASVPDVDAPNAGEMIEWLLGEGWFIDFRTMYIFIVKGTEAKSFTIEDFIENALADACAWVLEGKK